MKINRFNERMPSIKLFNTLNTREQQNKKIIYIILYDSNYTQIINKHSDMNML